MAFSLSHHGWEEQADELEVRENVDAEDLFEVGVTGMEDCVGLGDARVVDQNGGGVLFEDRLDG